MVSFEFLKDADWYKMKTIRENVGLRLKKTKYIYFFNETSFLRFFLCETLLSLNGITQLLETKETN